MSKSHPGVIALVVSLTAASSAFGAGQVEKIEAAHDAAPGTNGVYSDFFAPCINNAGEVAFMGYLKTPGGISIPNGAWMGTPQNVTLLEQGGQVGPGTGATVTGNPGFVLTNVAGQAYWEDSLSNGFGGLPEGVFHFTIGTGLSTVTFSGQPAAQTASSQFNSFSPNIFSEPGLAMYYAALDNTTINTSPSTAAGWWQVNSSTNTTQAVLQLGMAAPDVNSTFVGFSGMRMNASGAVLFCGNVANTLNLGQPGGPQPGTNGGFYDGLWTGMPGQLHLAVRSTDPAPGYPSGSTIGLIYSAVDTFNSAGQILFFTQVQLAGGGTPSTAWLRQPNGSLSAVLKDGDPLPGATQSETISSVFSSSPLINRTGDLVIRAAITGPSVNSNNDRAILAGTPGDLNVVARLGDPAPGVPGASFIAFDNTFLNNNGDVAFTAYLTGSNITGGTYGLWIWRPGSGLAEVLRDGATITLAPGDVRTLAPTSFHPGITISGDGNPDDGLGHVFNDADQFAAQLYFADGSDAVVRLTAPPASPVPEPATALLSVGSMALLLIRRRKRQQVSQRSGSI